MLKIGQLLHFLIGHSWTKWKVTRVGDYPVYQERMCTVCGKTVKRGVD